MQCCAWLEIPGLVLRKLAHIHNVGQPYAKELTQFLEATEDDLTQGANISLAYLHCAAVAVQLSTASLTNTGWYLG